MLFRYVTKKLNSCNRFSTGLDYKKMSDSSLSPLEALNPVLTSHNVLAISKLASRIPELDGTMLSPSSVHATWLKKLFWNGDPQLLKKAPQSVPEWGQAYDICRKYFDRLSPSDFIAFADEITFSSHAVSQVTEFLLCFCQPFLSVAVMSL